MSTPYHARYYAHELTRRGSDGMERLSRSLFDACVDLNPHQIDAALFALRSPVSKGVLLADEVGLGKTIEAGLVICQFWAERKRRIIVVCPASLRKQWALELEEKFHLPAVVLDGKTYRAMRRNGCPSPFEFEGVVVCSMHFASARAAEIRAVPWDLAVIDEAHKLRNAYRKSNKMGRNIKWALEGRLKILLTATPLQNSLLELYGLAGLIDERIFGDPAAFRMRYMNAGGDLRELRERLKFFCKRTLRRQVTEYIRYTERRLITRPFTPTEEEHRLYEAVSEFLKREDTYALPTSQRHLTVLIVRKLLASSSRAVAATLERMRDRLVALREGAAGGRDDLVEGIVEDEEMEDELLEEIFSSGLDDEARPQEHADAGRPVDLRKLDAEIEELEGYIRRARAIGVDSKSRALLKALEIGFAEMKRIGAAEKAVVFTESRRTQRFLKDFLESNGYAGRVVTFNGTNRDPESTRIYERWLEKNRGGGRIGGSRGVDVRTAIIEHFRDEASVMIATEAAAEGINLQFCSLVVNYDLPWNPQRIEQRIGRCHRYGQKHDVVVINFLNERNAADRRVYELLEEKFNLFTGVFGASDEVLGTIESGVDFERRILDIYQQCRTPREIDEAFEALRRELDEKIDSRIRETRRILLEHFDEEVHARLKVNLSGAKERLDRLGKLFWELTRFVLRGAAEFDDEGLVFRLLESPVDEVEPGTYRLISKDRSVGDAEFLYRLGHPLGEYVLRRGREWAAPAAEVEFDISSYPARISVVEKLKGTGGWLVLRRLEVDSFEREEYLLFSGFDDEGNALDQETFEKMFNCRGRVLGEIEPAPEVRARLNAEADRHAEAVIAMSMERNDEHFNEARDRLEKWAEEVVLGAEKELRDTKERIKELNRRARRATTLDEQRELQEKIRMLERKKRRQRQRIFEIEDEVEAKRDELIEALEKRMKQKTHMEDLFMIRWKVV